MSIFSALLLALLAAPPQAASAPSAATPGDVTVHVEVANKDRAPATYELAHGSILVRLTINGQPATAMVDNATQRTLIDPQFAKKVGLRLSPSRLRFDTPTGTSGAVQRADGVVLVIPRMLTFSGALPAVDLASLSARLGLPVNAIIGSDALDRFALVVQPGKRELSIVSSGAVTLSAGTPTIPLMDCDVVDATVNGQPVRLQVDLGAGTVVSLTDAAWARAIAKGTATSAGRLTNAAGQVVSAQVASADVRLGRVSANGVPVSNGYVSGKEDGALGNQFFSHFDLVLDAPRHQLALLPVSAATQPAGPH